MNRMRNLQTIYAHGPIIYETNIIQLNLAQTVRS